MRVEGNPWVSGRDLLGTARVRLFCLPHAGSGAAAFYRWKRALAGAVDVCPILLPGREARFAEPLAESAGTIAEALLGEPELYARPYAVLGHSMGALLAFAWAQGIAGSGMREPVCVFVSGRDAPGFRDGGPYGAGRMAGLADGEFVAELDARYGGVPAGFLEDPDLREMFLPILRADLRVVETYEPMEGRLLGCPIVATAGVDDRSVSDEGLAGWRQWTTGEFVSERLPGDHFFHVGEGQDALLGLIGNVLGRRLRSR